MPKGTAVARAVRRKAVRVGVALSWLSIAVVGLAAMPRRAHALDNPFPDSVVVSPGVKVAYTFGPEGGWTLGLELTLLYRTTESLSPVLAHGPAFNVTWTPSRSWYLRTGWQIVSFFVGFEAGPALVVDGEGAHLGFGLTPWLGAVWVVPYFTHTFVLGGRGLSELGTYLKLPLCTGCESDGGSGYWDWDDD